MSGGESLPMPTVDDDSNDEAGPAPPPGLDKPKKKRKVLEFQHVYLDNLPCAGMYERSYMHQNTVTHVLFTKNNFLVTASSEGHIKFWKKKHGEIEFIKRYIAHMGPVTALSASLDGAWLASISSKDCVANVFDVVNFDMVNRLQLDFSPACIEWVHGTTSSKPLFALGAVSDALIRIFDSRGDKGTPLTTVSVHSAPVTMMRMHPQLNAVISTDTKGMIEMWDVISHKLPAGVRFQFKSQTDLYDLAKCKTKAYSLDLSPDGEIFACVCGDQQIRFWKCLTGKLYKMLDESLAAASAAQAQEGPLQLDALDFGKRMSVEKELIKEMGAGTNAGLHPNVVFDQSGKIVMYAALTGVKIVNLVENKVVRILGKPENFRFLSLSLSLGASGKNAQTAKALEVDPTICATGFGRSRFYLFSRREPSDGAQARDVLNEKPQNELLAAAATTKASLLGKGAVIHTTMGDITVRLYPDECPKTVENFCTHSRNNYYNGVLFHRIIKGFMLQTGDPLGDGTGGTSIWGSEFEDEFHRSLRHDRPFTLSMANAGPNTNGSQFFITTVPTPWLDNKHSVFGRCVKGMDVVQLIENVKTSKDDKPFDDISIVNIRILDHAPTAK